MKLSFSTRGWRSLPWKQQVLEASEMRFNGIEVYNLHQCSFLTDRSGAFHLYHQHETLRDLADHSLTIPCFDTSVDLSEPLPDLPAVIQLIDTAGNMHVPYVAFCALQDREDMVRENLSELLPAAQSKGVTLLLKSTGIYANTIRLRDLMDSYACDELAALWDMHHPFRDFQESPDSTIRNLRGYVRHVRLRDSG